VKLVCLFFSTAILVAVITAGALWLLPMIAGRLPLTRNGFAVALHQVNWDVVVTVAVVCGVLRVLSQFECFSWLCDLFRWVDVLLRRFDRALIPTFLYA